MQKLFWIILITAINCATYLKTKEFAFIWNDRAAVETNAFVNPPSRESIRQVWRGDGPGSYVPVKLTLLAGLVNLDQRFATHTGKDGSLGPAESPYALNPKVFHVANLVVHIANTILVFLILSMVLKKTMGASLGALVFALHPLQTETIVSIANVGILLGTFFALFAVRQYLEFSSRQSGQVRKNRNPMRYYHIATAAFILAVLSNPAMVVTPVIAFVLEKLLPRERSFLPSRRPAWPLAIWLVGALPVSFMAISAEKAAAVANEFSFWTRPLIAADSLIFYLQKVFVPIGIGPDYGRSPGVILEHWWIYVSWLLPLGITTVLLFWKERSRAWIAAAFGTFVAALLPYLGLIAFESQGISTVANRYAYLAMVGPAIAAAYFASLPKRTTLRLVISIAIGLMAGVTFEQVNRWRDDESLWKLALEVNEKSPVAHKMLADGFREKGEWEKARTHYLMVLKSSTTDPQIHYHLAQIEEKQGNLKEAVQLYSKVLDLDPEFADAHDSLGLALLASDDFPAAMGHFEKAVGLDGDNAKFLHHYGRSLVLLEKHDAAIPVLRKALKAGGSRMEKIEAAAVQALLGKTLAAIGQKEMGQIHLESALKLDPEHSEANRILADMYVAQENFDEALKHYLKAVSGFPNDPELLNNLGVIYLKRQDYVNAKTNFELALKVDKKPVSALENLGIAYFHLRDYGAAKEYIESALAQDPQRVDSQYYLGEMARLQGKDDVSLAHYYAALKISPDHTKANNRLGEYFVKNDKLTAAIRYFRAALKSSPEDKRISASLQNAEKLKEESAF